MACATIWVMAPSDDYQPSERLAAAIEAFDEADAAREAAKDELRAAVVEELKTRDVTVPRLTKELPWSMETVRTLAREAGVPRRREPTVEARRKRKRPRP